MCIRKDKGSLFALSSGTEIPCGTTVQMNVNRSLRLFNEAARIVTGASIYTLQYSKTTCRSRLGYFSVVSSFGLCSVFENSLIVNGDLNLKYHILKPFGLKLLCLNQNHFLFERYTVHQMQPLNG